MSDSTMFTPDTARLAGQRSGEARRAQSEARANALSPDAYRARGKALLEEFLQGGARRDDLRDIALCLSVDLSRRLLAGEWAFKDAAQAAAAARSLAELFRVESGGDPSAIESSEDRAARLVDIANRVRTTKRIS